MHVLCIWLYLIVGILPWYMIVTDKRVTCNARLQLSSSERVGARVIGAEKWRVMMGRVLRGLLLS